MLANSAVVITQPCQRTRPRVLQSVDCKGEGEGVRKHTLVGLEEPSWGVRAADGLDFGVCDADVAGVEKEGRGVGVLLGFDDFVEKCAVDVCGRNVRTVTAV